MSSPQPNDESSTEHSNGRSPSLSTRVGALEMTLQNRTAERDGLRVMFEQKAAECDELAQENELLLESLAECKKKIQTNMELEHERQEHQKMKETFLGELYRVCQQRDLLEATAAADAEKITALSKRNEQLEAAVKLQEQENLRGTLTERDNELEAMRRELRVLREEKEALSTEVAQLLRQKDSYTEISAHNDALVSENQKLAKELETTTKLWQMMVASRPAATANGMETPRGRATRVSPAAGAQAPVAPQQRRSEDGTGSPQATPPEPQAASVGPHATSTASSQCQLPHPDTLIEDCFTQNLEGALSLHELILVQEYLFSILKQSNDTLHTALKVHEVGAAAPLLEAPAVPKNRGERRRDKIRGEETSAGPSGSARHPRAAQWVPVQLKYPEVVLTFLKTVANSGHVLNTLAPKEQPKN